MWQIQVLDVAIGLFLMYLLFSLMCTAVTEMVSAIGQLRARMLERRLKEMLGSERARQLYEQLFIKPGKRLPARVKAQDFSFALLEVLAPSAPGGLQRTPSVLRSSLEDAHAAAGRAATKLTSASTREEIKDAKNCARSVVAISALVNDAGRDMAKVKANLEQWFDNAMERLTEEYKRNAQIAVSIVGLAIAVGLNADTIFICRRLWTDTAVRSALVAAASRVAPTPASDSLVTGAEPTAGDSSAKAVPTLAQVRKELEGIELPIGWQFVFKPKAKPAAKSEAEPALIPAVKPAAKQADPEPLDLRFWVLKGVGWLITALAISLGAPFWFDLLGKLVHVKETLKTKPAAES